MNAKDILKSMHDKKFTPLGELADTELVCIHSESDHISDDMIAAAKISPELYQIILKNCTGQGLPSLTCWYDNGVLRPGIRRGQR